MYDVAAMEGERGPAGLVTVTCHSGWAGHHRTRRSDLTASAMLTAFELERLQNIARIQAVAAQHGLTCPELNPLLPKPQQTKPKKKAKGKDRKTSSPQRRSQRLLASAAASTKIMPSDSTSQSDGEPEQLTDMMEQLKDISQHWPSEKACKEAAQKLLDAGITAGQVGEGVLSPDVLDEIGGFSVGDRLRLLGKEKRRA